ncbi:acetate/propionate family kinase [Acidocella sp. KAb 2-4]|uniref:acetate/propionate family kinase n=1 Tax=Acidocella sp. KAb 2-4 TaxID=2885158 RepID=UPI001D06B5DD|nr:acetate/propionate family kinase [Acidocella sp. KAb 2-4]MCB5944164.1 acetate/propionate family kinase [Acidocella sp. KAb 2-4]
MADAVLTINAGSSSIKFALFETADGLTRIAEGLAEGIGTAPHLRISANGALALERRWPAHAAETHEDLMREVLGWVEAHLGADRLIAAGHRIVHGGNRYTAPTRLDAEVMAHLAELNPLAPLHEPHNLAAVRAVLAVRPALPQIGCFDTAFHHTIPETATRLALPRAFHDEGVRRYGFHGLSYEYIAGRLRETVPDLAQGRVIVAHLGNGASLCALRGGLSVDTTMGFTALEGLMMGTRCGSIDPGVLIYLSQSHGMDAAAITDLLYKQSGLLGVSGISPDVRTLLQSKAPEAAEALELFAYSAARHAGALISCLGGLDGIVFTAGIGEHAAPIRAAICQRLAWTGARLSPEANAAAQPVISTADSKVEIRIIPTDEELMIARHTLVSLG